MDKQIAAQVYTLCLRMTAQRTLAAHLAAEAMSEAAPLAAAVKLTLQTTSHPSEEALSALEAAILALPPHQRLAVLLTDTLGLSAREAADYLQLTPEAFQLLRVQGRRTLMDAY